MTYQVYTFAPDAELMDELDELDEAIARCEELVHEDGYPVAEIWDSSGDRVHSVGRGGAWVGYAGEAPDEADVRPSSTGEADGSPSSTGAASGSGASASDSLAATSSA